MVLVDARVYSEHGKLFRCDITPGSMERSIDHYKDVSHLYVSHLYAFHLKVYNIPIVL
jgi:hypothetical protein